MKPFIFASIFTIAAFLCNVSQTHAQSNQSDFNVPPPIPQIPSLPPTVTTTTPTTTTTTQTTAATQTAAANVAISLVVDAPSVPTPPLTIVTTTVSAPSAPPMPSATISINGSGTVLQFDFTPAAINFTIIGTSSIQVVTLA